MAQYLSAEWFQEMAAAAADYKTDEPSSRSVSLREIVTGAPNGDVTYVMTVEDGKIRLTTGNDDAPPADVTFTQDYETAAAIHRGELTTHEAFFAGRVRVAGHLNTLLENSELLHGIASVFADVRAQTTY